MPKLSKNKAARAQYKAKLEANRKAKEKAKKEAIKLTEQEKKDKQNELRRQKRAIIKAEKEKSVQEYRKSQLNLPYDKLLPHTLITHLLNATIVGTDENAGIKENVVNLSIKTGLYNSKFPTKNVKNFATTHKPLLQEFIFDYIRGYSKDNNEGFAECPTQVQYNILAEYSNAILSSFNTTATYFATSHMQYARRKIRNLIDPRSNEHIIPTTGSKLLQPIKQPQEYYIKEKNNPNKRENFLNMIRSDAILLTQKEVAYYEKQIDKNCKKYNITRQQFFYEYVPESMKLRFEADVMINTILTMKKYRRNFPVEILCKIADYEIVDCDFFPKKELEPFLDDNNQKYFKDDLPLLCSHVATYAIIEGYKRFRTYCDNTRNTQNSKYKTFEYGYYQRTYTLTASYIEQLNKAFFLLLEILTIYPSPVRKKRKEAEYDWGRYFFDKKADFYFITQIDDYTKIREIQNKYITIDSIHDIFKALSELLTPIFYPLDFPEIYQEMKKAVIVNDTLGEVPQKNNDTKTRLTSKRAQELLILNVVNLKGENLFTEILHILDCLTYILDKYLQKGQKRAKHQTNESITQNNDDTKLAVGSETTTNSEAYVNPYPDVDW